LSKDNCEINDFKTGDPSEEHANQLRIYALLWARDTTHNPSGRLASRLRLLYSAKVQEVSPPSEGELVQLEQELAQRTDAASALLAERPPPARPTVDACAWCDVKHLCTKFWEQQTQTRLFGLQRPLPTRADVEAQVTQQLGESSWRGKLSVQSVLDPGSQVLLRANPQDTHFSSLIHTGRSYRMLDTYVMPATEESAGLPIVTLNSRSELFALLE
jgi:hypothetical protein